MKDLPAVLIPPSKLGGLIRLWWVQDVPKGSPGKLSDILPKSILSVVEPPPENVIV
jgi:hypothetical protein